MADAALESALDRLGHGGVGDAVEVVDLRAGLSSEGQRVLMPLTPQQLTVLGRVHALGEATLETLGEDLTEVESLVFQDVLVRIPDSNGEVIAVTPAANTERMARAERKRELKELWAETADADGSHAKGASLQRFAEALFSESFKVLFEGPVRLDTAELDLVLEASQATDRRFRTGYVLVELKNWTAPVGSEVVSQLVGRLLARNCKQGILVTRGRVTRDAELEAQNVAHDRQVIIVQGADIERYLLEPSLRFSDLLTGLHANLMLRPRRR
jgi:restriction endonuclease Mrr